MSSLTGIDRDALARVVAADIPPGSFVNLGTSFAELTSLLDVPLVDGTREAAS